MVVKMHLCEQSPALGKRRAPFVPIADILRLFGFPSGAKVDSGGEQMEVSAGSNDGLAASSVSSIECCRTLASETRRWYEASELSFDQVSKGDRCAVLKDGSNNLNAYR